MATLLALYCGRKGSGVWLNEASVISGSEALLGYTSHPLPLPVQLVSLASLVLSLRDHSCLLGPLAVGWWSFLLELKL